jgi:hypothetical protein
MAASAVMILHGLRAGSPVVTDNGCCPSAAQAQLPDLRDYNLNRRPAARSTLDGAADPCVQDQAARRNHFRVRDNQPVNGPGDRGSSWRLEEPYTGIRGSDRAPPDRQECNSSPLAGHRLVAAAFLHPLISGMAKMPAVADSIRLSLLIPGRARTIASITPETGQGHLNIKEPWTDRQLAAGPIAPAILPPAWYLRLIPEEERYDP